METQTLLPGVKTMLGITGDYQDELLSAYIADVLYFMQDAGVDETILSGPTVLGVVARGVSDLWNYGIGGTTFSPYFFQRVTQLVYKGGV